MKPKTGDHFEDRLNPGCTWRVEAVGAHSGTVYVRMFRGGSPTQAVMEWPMNRWSHFVETQLEDGASEGNDR